MKSHHAALSILLLVLVTSVPTALAQETCQAVQVIDPCNGYVNIYHVGAPQGRVVGLDPDAALLDVVFSTMPGFEHRLSFLLQGTTIRTIESYDEFWGVRPEALDLLSLPGLAGFEPRSIAAGSGLGVQQADGSVDWQYSLYVVGKLDDRPYFVALDQEALEAETRTGLVLGQGVLCEADTVCTGEASRVAVHVDAAGAELAYVTTITRVTMEDGVVKPRARERQRVIRVRRSPASPATWSIFDNPAVVGERWTGFDRASLGIDVGYGGDALAAFQTEARVKDAVSGATSCEFSSPTTDVAVWGTAPPTGPGLLQVATYSDPGTSSAGGFLGISPPLGCADPSDALSLERPAGGEALDVELSSKSLSPFWAYVPDGVTGVLEAIALDVRDDGQGLYAVELSAESFTIALSAGSDGTAACPTRVAVSAEYPDGASCVFPPPKEPPLPCCLFENNPRCQGLCALW